MGTLLTGTLLAVLTDTDSIPLISRSEARIQETANAPDGRAARKTADATRRETYRDTMATCQQARKNSDPVPDACRQSDQDRQKLLVLLALWRVLP